MTSITRFNILATALAGIILAASISYFFIFMPYQEYSHGADRLKQYYITQEKQEIRLEIRRALDELEFLHRNHIREISTNLSLNLTEIKTLIESSPSLNIDQAHSKFAHMRGDLSTLHNAAHLIFDAENNLVSRCSLKHMLKLGMKTDLSQAEIEALIKPLTDGPPQQHLEISWPAAHGDRMLRVHALYENTAQNNFRIIALLPRHISDKYLQRSFLERLSKVCFGADGSGYLYVINNKAQPIMAPILTPAYNQDISPLPVPADSIHIARQFVSIAQNGGGYLEYVYENPSTHKPENKISYVAPMPMWGWILGTGFYTSSLDQRVQEQQQQLLSDTHRRARIGVIVVMINLILGLVISYVTNRHVGRIETKREEHLNRLQQYSSLLDELCLVSKGDLDGNITYVNDKFAEVSGYSREEMLGQPHNIVRHPSVPKSVFKRMWQRLQAGTPWRGISRNKTKNGASYYADSVIMPLTDQDGNVVEYIAARYEITELLEKRDEVRLAFSTDKLTSLGSRYKLIEDLRAGEKNRCLALFDIVDFGGINHSLGIETADQVLQHLSNQMVDFFAAENYSLYRLHSDIFAVLSATTTQADMYATAKQFSQALSQNPFIGTSTGSLNLNLVSGIACNENDLLSCVDAALQYAKQNKTSIVAYNAEIAEHQGRKRAYWINEVQQALLDQRLVPHYQPIVHISSGEVRRYEALMRMATIDGEIIPPGAFLPIMEQTSHYAEMTRSIFKQACMFFRYRRESFSVNLTVDDLLRRKTIDFIATTATNYAVTDRLVLELVETENIHNYDVALKALAELKQLGIKIAIDDFGSGFANFSYLSAFPADIVKIDGSLVSKVNEDEKNRNLVKVLIDYAHSEGMEVIAEFVSSAEILETISAMGCDYAQGYYFSAPLPGAKIDAEQAV